MHSLFLFAVFALCGTGLTNLMEQQTDFGLRVFAEVARSTPDKNLAFSPYGISSVLGMAQLGAYGSTLNTLTAHMGYSLHQRGLPRQQRLLQRSVASEHGVELANGVMVDRKLLLEKSFRRGLGKAFQAMPHQLDFSQPEIARKIINAWVSDHTAGTIPQFLSSGAFSDQTRLVLLNAMHFHGMWKTPFDPKLTREIMFHGVNGSKVLVPMMVSTQKFNYGDFVTPEGVEYDVIEVPYAGDSLSMLLVSPFEHDTPLSSLRGELHSQKLQEWRQDMRRVNRQLALPRFAIDADMDLKSALYRIGLGDLFSQTKADFSRITTEEPLCVSKVLQSVKLEVNEEGTTGSSATAAIVFSRMAIEEITLDHPFLFLIQHKQTGAVLFAGQLNQPEGQ